MHEFSPTLGAAKFKRVVVPAPSREELATFVGVFFSNELKATFRAGVTGDGKLEWHSVRGKAVALQPLLHDAFPGSGLGTFTFRRPGSGEIAGLTISASNGRVRRLTLTKMAQSN